MPFILINTHETLQQQRHEESNKIASLQTHSANVFFARLGVCAWMCLFRVEMRHSYFTWNNKNNLCETQRQARGQAQAKAGWQPPMLEKEAVFVVNKPKLVSPLLSCRRGTRRTYAHTAVSLNAECAREYLQPPQLGWHAFKKAK